MKIRFFCLVLCGLIFTGCSFSKVKVSFNTMGGNEISPIIINKGSTIDFPDFPKKDGMCFKGWTSNGVQFLESTPINTDITLVAIWTSCDVFNQNNEIEDNQNNNNNFIQPESNPNNVISSIPVTTKHNNSNLITSSTTNNINHVITTSQYTNNIKISAKKEYYCLNNSYTLKNKKCISTIEVDAYKEYYCDSGYYYNGSTCVRSVSNSDKVSGKKEYYCPSGFELYNDECVYQISSKPFKEYYCEDGVLEGSSCIKTSYLDVIYTSAAREYCYALFGSTTRADCLCNYMGGDYNSNSKTCRKNYTYKTDAKLVDYCLDGYVMYDNMCYTYMSSSALYNVECPSGYTYSGSGNICYKYTTGLEYGNVYSRYKCSFSDYKLKDNKCVKEFSSNALSKYVCPDGYYLDGIMCIK